MTAESASAPLRSVSSHDASDVLVARYRRIREFTARLCEELQPEDFVVQSMPDASPLRWHLAHTTWFFETFVLKPFVRDYQPLVEAYAYLFNSYYNALGDQYPRARRGILSRPTVREVWAYRQAIDERIVDMLSEKTTGQSRQARALIELGLQHEQQHQELMLTDIKHAFSCNPLLPKFREDRFQPTAAAQPVSTPPLRRVTVPGGLHEIGHADAAGAFAYDNELPRHQVYTGSFQLASRTITCGEYLAFIEDGGYRRPELWLSEGWSHATTKGWSAPLYWIWRDGAWYEFTLAGLQTLDPARPVCHLSYFEADAYARWCGGRLPTEFEWEQAAQDLYAREEFVSQHRHVFADQLIDDQVALHPQSVRDNWNDLSDMAGNVWEWTSSSYAPYPGYRPSEGAIGEYNGKFMCNQYVLRGGSCATSSDHIRVTYRNFFPARARWQFSGIRCAWDLS